MWWYNHLLVLWILAGLSCSGLLFYYLDKSYLERRQETLSSMCEERAGMLQDQFVASMNHVRALTALVTTFHLEKQPSALDQVTFSTYAARTACERPLMSGVAYAQKVLHEEREAFERLQGWSIKRMYSKDWQLVQQEYAPATLTQDTVGYLNSLDLMSGQEDRENILRARASGKGALTSPFRLLTNHLGIVFTFSVYTEDLPPDATPEHRIEHCAGYLGGAFDVESLVDNLLHQLAGSSAIVVSVYDVTNRSLPLVMYGFTPDAEQYYVRSLDFGDPLRKHEMRCRLVDPRPVSWSAVWASLGLLVICLLVGQIGFAASRRINQVELGYKKMAELKLRAESADVAKSQFLATVSHEIRTPMNGVLGMLQMLMDTKLDPTQMDYARTAQASGQALITLINEVLDQAKIESGRLELESVPFDLHTILDDVVSLFSSKPHDNEIERVPQVLIGDPGRFRQIITNLVGNSVKFTQRGHIFVCVHLAEDMEKVMKAMNQTDSAPCSRGEGENFRHIACDSLSGFEAADRRNCWEFFKLLLPDDAYETDAAPAARSEDTRDQVSLLFSVEDTGIGIPWHAQKRVFTPFMQADSSTSRTYGGTGIGLSISRCLVELMSGEMSFLSAPGIGTTFFFTLAIRKGHPIIGEDINLESKSKFAGLNALVVDGRHIRAHVTGRHLQRLGIRVHVVTEIPLAISILTKFSENVPTEFLRSSMGVDMVLVDKDAFGPGSGLYEQWTSAGVVSYENPPVFILLAASLTYDEAKQAKKAGFVDTVIRKPLRSSMLASSLEQALGISCKGNIGTQPPESFVALQTFFFGKFILVVDDNVVNRRVATAALKKYGANVDCAESGRTAVKLLHPPHKYHACFMDVQMPEMDGFEATRLIRKEEWAASCGICHNQDEDSRKWHTPIWAMTADLIQATHEECLRSGMDGYVSKPFDEEQLHQAVRRFLNTSQLRT